MIEESKPVEADREMQARLRPASGGNRPKFPLEPLRGTLFVGQ